MDIQPGRKVVDHNAPKHRCPVCNHVCHTVQRPRTAMIGRPARNREEFLLVLRTQAQEDQPISIDDLARILRVSPESVVTIAYRTRKSGFNVRNVRGQGYYLGGDGVR